MDLSAVRTRLESREEMLSPYAARSAETRGRETPEDPSPVRTEFQRDRDRILHCKAFRRLKHKTQVFIAPVGDHFVTRLTHTLEVAQIARTIARGLNLNEDLAEAVALAHDIGHPPFGHAGEQALADLLPEGFRHAEQSLRVVEKLERLNLTWETRDGIVNSSKVREDIFAEGYGTPATLEGQIVKVSDAVAYINHDIADALRANVIAEEELPREVSEVLGKRHSERINTLVCDIIENSWDATGEHPGAKRVRNPDRHERASVRRGQHPTRVHVPARLPLGGPPGGVGAGEARSSRSSTSHFMEHPDEVQTEFGIPSDPLWRQSRRLRLGNDRPIRAGHRRAAQTCWSRLAQAWALIK